MDISINLSFKKLKGLAFSSVWQTHHVAEDTCSSFHERRIPALSIGLCVPFRYGKASQFDSPNNNPLRRNVFCLAEVEMWALRHDTIGVQT